MDTRLQLPAQRLQDVGFALQGVLRAADHASLLPPAAQSYEQVLVLGNGGPELWEKLGPADGPDRIDRYAVDRTEAWLDEIGVPHWRLLYPDDDFAIDLRGLGKAFGWHHDSPLGSGIHPTFGSWFAYRVVVALPAFFELSDPGTQPSPCNTCESKPCLAACPVGATGMAFNLDACASHRVAAPECASQCLARNTCPVGQGYRYGETQMRYHYGHSLQTIRLLHSRG